MKKQKPIPPLSRADALERYAYTGLGVAGFVAICYLIYAFVQASL